MGRETKPTPPQCQSDVLFVTHSHGFMLHVWLVAVGPTFSILSYDATPPQCRATALGTSFIRSQVSYSTSDIAAVRPTLKSLADAGRELNQLPPLYRAEALRVSRDVYYTFSLYWVMHIEKYPILFVYTFQPQS